MKGLAPHTQKIIESVSRLECIKPYTLVGGTALSLQLGTRQSEDLDFMKWRTSKNEKMEVAWYQIEKELLQIGKIQHKDLLVTHPIAYQNNILLADIISIGAMKIEVMLRRSNFRDYYDIYSILQNNVPIQELITLAASYSGHKLKTKNIMAILTNSKRFIRDAHFEQLQPSYKISPQEIEEYIKFCLSNK